MTGRSPARLLAPLALAACTVALFVVVSSGGGESGSGTTGGSPAEEATPTATPEERRDRRRRRYVVKAGDTPSAIAEKLDVSLDELLEANPDADPNALVPGQRLTVP